MEMCGVGKKTSKNGVIFFAIFIPFLALCGPQLLQQISESLCYLKSYFMIRKKRGTCKIKRISLPRLLKTDIATYLSLGI